MNRVPVRRWWTAWLLCLSCALAAASKPVTLQLKWKHQWQFAGYYAAQEKGYYRDAGLDVTFREAEPGVSTVDTVLQGQAIFGIGTSDLVLHRAQGRPVVSLAVIFQHSPLVLMARADRGIRHIHDLAGRRVQFEEGAAELKAYLIQEGIHPQQYETRTHPFGIQDLVEGRVDVLSAYRTDEPFHLREAGVEPMVFSPQAAGLDFYGDTLFTTESMVNKDPALVKAFREASLKGWRYALGHPEELADLILTRYGSRHSREHLLFEAREVERHILPSLVELGYQYPGRWHHIAGVYRSLGMLQGETHLDGFLYRERRGLESRTLLLLAASFGAIVLLGGIVFHYVRLARRLRGALAQVQTLSGLLPICASCKMIRDDQGFWTQVESYVQAHSGATFSHGLCPNCAKSMRTELGEIQERRAAERRSGQGIRRS